MFARQGARVLACMPKSIRVLRVNREIAVRDNELRLRVSTRPAGVGIENDWYRNFVLRSLLSKSVQLTDRSAERDSNSNSFDSFPGSRGASSMGSVPAVLIPVNRTQCLQGVEWIYFRLK